MSYEVKSKGWAQFRGFDLMCGSCDHHEDILLERADFLDENGDRKKIQKPCPECGGVMEEVWIQAPSTFSRDGTDAGVAKMKRSFNERFIKKEVDDVRHKYGRLYDDSIKSAAVNRLRKGKA
jgi:hypothetical protein